MAANQAQMLMLLNQVKNLESQLQMSQNQGMTANLMNGISQTQAASNPMSGINMNLLNVLSQMQSKGSKPMKSEKAKPSQVQGKPGQNNNPTLAKLLAALTGSDSGKQERGRCIWITGLPESFQDADKLSNLFGNFGNVRKVVFTEKKPDGALIELDDARGCVKAVANMRGKKLDGQDIKISFTSIDQAGMKKDSTKSKDFREAKETWRFTGNKDSKFRRICMKRLRKLSSTIVVSNLPEGKADQLKKFIIESGYTVKSMEGSQRPVDESKPKSGYTMVVVELASVDEAIDAVATLHNSWPKKFGTMKKDRFDNSRGLVFSLAGVKETADKAKA